VLRCRQGAFRGATRGFAFAPTMPIINNDDEHGAIHSTRRQYPQ
jgi:hypothetical protein